MTLWGTNIRREARRKLSTLLWATAAGLLGMQAAMAGDKAVDEIRAVIARDYDHPDSKVETSPVVISGRYAVADWVQGESGGRALLRRDEGFWSVILCAGDGLRSTAGLKEAGVPAKEARRLESQLSLAESRLAPEHVRRFSLFDSRDKSAAEHHHGDHGKH